MKLIVALVMLTALSARGVTEGTVTFLDSCTKQATGVRMPGMGLEVKVALRGLDPALVTDVEVSVSPARDVSGEATVGFEARELRAQADGTLVLTRAVALPDEGTLGRQELPRLWIAHARWSQEGRPDSEASAEGRVYLARPRERRFYRILRIADEPKLCRWESRPRLQSSYEENRSSVPKRIELKRPYSPDPGEQGVDLGITTTSELPSPLLSIPGDDHAGWMFGGWERAYGKLAPWGSTVSEELAPQTGGFFVESRLYTRYWAEEHRWRSAEREGACGTWEKMSSGWLDVGVPKVEFVTVPAEHAHARSATEYLATVRPPADSCALDATRGLPKAERSRLVEGSSAEYELYFYPMRALSPASASRLLVDGIAARFRDAVRAPAATRAFGPALPETVPVRRELADDMSRNPAAAYAFVAALTGGVAPTRGFRPASGQTLSQGWLRELLALPGIDVNLRDEHGCTPLFYATAGGMNAVVRALLSAPGVIPEGRDHCGALRAKLRASILEIADSGLARMTSEAELRRVFGQPSGGAIPPAKQAEVELWKDLMRKANAMLKEALLALFSALDANRERYSPHALIAAFQRFHADGVAAMDALQITRSLAPELGNLLGIDGVTLLHVAARSGHAGGDYRVLESFLELTPLDVNAPAAGVFTVGKHETRIDAATPLLVAAAGWGDTALLRILLAHPRIDTAAPAGDGATALEWAIVSKTDRETLVALLADTRFDVNQPNRRGLTVAQLAVESFAKLVVRCLDRVLEPIGGPPGGDLEGDQGRRLRDEIDGAITAIRAIRANQKPDWSRGGESGTAGDIFLSVLEPKRQAFTGYLHGTRDGAMPREQGFPRLALDLRDGVDVMKELLSLPLRKQQANPFWTVAVGAIQNPQTLPPKPASPIIQTPPPPANPSLEFRMPPGLECPVLPPAQRPVPAPFGRSAGDRR